MMPPPVLNVRRIDSDVRPILDRETPAAGTKRSHAPLNDTTFFYAEDLDHFEKWETAAKRFLHDIELAREVIHSVGRCRRKSVMLSHAELSSLQVHVGSLTAAPFHSHQGLPFFPARADPEAKRSSSQYMQDAPTRRRTIVPNGPISYEIPAARPQLYLASGQSETPFCWASTARTTEEHEAVSRTQGEGSSKNDEVIWHTDLRGQAVVMDADIDTDDFIEQSQLQAVDEESVVEEEHRNAAQAVEKSHLSPMRATLNALPLITADLASRRSSGHEGKFLDLEGTDMQRLLARWTLLPKEAIAEVIETKRFRHILPESVTELTVSK